MAEFELFQIFVAVVVVIVSGYMVINRWSNNKQQIAVDLTNRNNDCRLMIDSDQKLFYKWLQSDTQQNVSWATGDMFGAPKSKIKLEKMQNGPWDCYPPRFPTVDDTENDFYFRCGKYLNTDRFDVVLMPSSNDNANPLIFGHIEFVFAESKRFNKRIVWLYCVYIAPQFRGKGLGKLMINKRSKKLTMGLIGGILIFCNISIARLWIWNH